MKCEKYCYIHIPCSTVTLYVWYIFALQRVKKVCALEHHIFSNNLQCIYKQSKTKTMTVCMFTDSVFRYNFLLQSVIQVVILMYRVL
jgi:hypothetical protein